jgi:hypothetical protein
VLLVGSPLLGIILARKPLSLYLEFPPVTVHVEHAPFSWLVFLALAVLLSVAIRPFLAKVMNASAPVRDEQARRSLPWWGWVGAGVLALAWILAWTRFSWFKALQPFTFSPLWLGYILVINALTYKRTGHSMMTDRPRYFLGLFPLSAAFWWFFEYLNRFVQNWYYVGIETFGPAEYILYATLPFSTVLPAVLGTKEWLETFPRLTAALTKFRPLRIAHPTALSAVVLATASAGLMGVGVWPNYLYPLLWIAPLLIMLAIQGMLGEETILSGIRRGDWREVWLSAIAGLTCGLLWELWNSRSLAHWEYAVPYVHRFLVFQMPLLGYMGYLPFGLECAVIADLFLGRKSTKTT